MSDYFTPNASQRIRDLEREVERLNNLSERVAALRYRQHEADRADAGRFRWLVERFANGSLLQDTVLLVASLDEAHEDIRALIDTDRAKDPQL